MIIDVGTKSNDVTLSWETLYSYNRKILDADKQQILLCARACGTKGFAVPKTFHAKLPLHPEKPEQGFREYTVTPESRESGEFLGFKKRC